MALTGGFFIHVWRSGWDDLNPGLSWDSWQECPYLASPCGLGFLTVWQPLGSLTFEEVQRSSVAPGASVPAGREGAVCLS